MSDEHVGEAEDGGCFGFVGVFEPMGGPVCESVSESGSPFWAKLSAEEEVNMVLQVSGLQDGPRSAAGEMKAS